MKSSQQFSTEEDLVELSKQGYFTIMQDEALKRQARGWAILTKNSQDFIDEAVRYDYDVIGVEDIKFVDDKTDRSNETARKISSAVRRSQLATRKGNFWLKIRDNGIFHLEQLV